MSAFSVYTFHTADGEGGPNGQVAIPAAKCYTGSYLAYASNLGCCFTSLGSLFRKDCYRWPILPPMMPLRRNA